MRGILDLNVELAQPKSGRLASGLDNQSHLKLATSVCQDHEMKKLAGLSTQLKSEIRDLQDQLASFADQHMKFEGEIHNWKCRTVL